MREYKFRAFDKEQNEFITDYDTGDYSAIEFQGGTFEVIQLILEDALVNGEHEQYESVNRITEMVEVMQYTGLTDRNGVEIYSGDIVKVDYRDIRYPPHVSTVEWDNESASFDFGGGVPSEVVWSHEVIGNIHQHPHLLEGE